MNGHPVALLSDVRLVLVRNYFGIVRIKCVSCDACAVGVTEIEMTHNCNPRVCVTCGGGELIYTMNDRRRVLSTADGNLKWLPPATGGEMRTIASLGRKKR
jgi:hypothetical protein